MRKLVAYLQSVATGKAVLWFFVPAMAVYSVMLLYTIPQVAQYAPEMQLFDLSPTGYSFTYALELSHALGVKGRDLYLYQQLPMDFIYPGLFAVSGCLLLSWLFSKSLKEDSRMFYLCFVPVVAGMFDYLENICIALMLTSYPDLGEVHVNLASFMTILKSGFTTAFFLILIIGFILFLKRKRELLSRM